MKSIRSRSRPINKISATDVFPSTSKLRDLFPSLLPGFLYSFREWRYEIKAYFVIILAIFTEFWLSFIKGKFSQENQRKTSFSFKSSAVRIQCVVQCTLAALAARLSEWVSYSESKRLWRAKHANIRQLYAILCIHPCDYLCLSIHWSRPTREHNSGQAEVP